MAALPFQGSLIVPIQWQGQTQKTTMQAAGYQLSGTIGWRPWTETATLSWVLSEVDAKTLLDLFKDTKFNGVYDYTCNTRGAVRVRLDGTYAFTEVRDPQMVQLSVGVTVV